MPVGRVETGILKPGMVVTFAPANLTTEVKSVEMHHEQREEAVSGDKVGFNVKNVSVKDIRRGMVVGDAFNEPPEEADNFTALITVLNHSGEIRAGYMATVRVHTAEVVCKFHELLQKIDSRTGRVVEENPEKIRRGDTALVDFMPSAPLHVENFGDYPALGRFTAEDMGTVVAMGIIKEVVNKEASGGKISKS